MRTFAQKPKTTQPNRSATSSTCGQLFGRQAHDANSVLHLQSTIGSHTAPRFLLANAEERNALLIATTSPHLEWDFTRIPVSPPQAGAFQTKPAINEPGDEYEQEADHVAEQVMGMPKTQMKRCCRCSNGCSTCQQERPDRAPAHLQTTQVKTSDAERMAAPPIVHEVIAAPGQPLDSPTRAFFEPRFGHDFSRVRIHTDTRATESARAVNALAYTVGQDVVFGLGRYNPQSDEGQQLLAHELTHTVQQGDVPRTDLLSALRVSDPGEASERQADEIADRVMSNPGRNVIGSVFSAESNLLQRAVSYDECTSAEETVVLASHNRAMSMVTNAVTKLRTYNGTTPADVKTALDTHFHSSGTILAAWIAHNLDWLKGESNSPTYECEKPQVGSRLGWSMWCVPWTDIELYPLWFAQSDIDQRARTMIHEWVHRYGCNFDLGYEWEEGYSGHGTLRSLLNADPWAHFVYDIR